jgi:hypothetical protein
VISAEMNISRLKTSLALAAARNLSMHVKSQTIHPNQPVILCMNRAVLASDIEAMRLHTKLNFATVSAAAFEKLFEWHVPTKDRIQSFYTLTYLNYPREQREKLKSIAREFLHETGKRVRYDAIVIGNCDYWQDEMLYDVCKEDNVPVIVLCRESCVMGADIQRERYAQAKYIFRGTAMAVDSETTKDVLLSTGAYSAGTIHAVGWPRFDKWVNFVPKTNVSKRDILLIAYQEKGYLAPKNFVDVLKLFVQAARQRNHSNRFCIKLKKASHIKNLLLACPQLLFSGIRITSKTPMDELIKSSAMVIGYNTTGVLEGYLSDSAVVVPWWKDSVRERSECLIYEPNEADRAVTYFPKSALELGQHIHAALEGRLPPKGSHELRLKHFSHFIRHEPPNLASSRFEKLVLDCLNETRASIAA